MRFFAIAMMLAALSGCKDEYDFDEYERLRNSDELEDVVHEWMREYIERYCRVSARGEIECE
jgi:hypothetical protein